MTAGRAAGPLLHDEGSEPVRLAGTEAGGRSSAGMTQDWLPVDAGQFERHRPRLFGIAYRMLGSVEDAEDVVQESFLRWDDADPAEVRSAEAWLVAVTTRLAIDRPVPGRDRAPALRGQLAPRSRSRPPRRRPTAARSWRPISRWRSSRCSSGWLREERAALLLRDVFDAGYGEIARVLERSEAACRQLVHRALQGAGTRAANPVPRARRDARAAARALPRGARRGR